LHAAVRLDSLVGVRRKGLETTPVRMGCQQYVNDQLGISVAITLVMDEHAQFRQICLE
jgi:hypothetical protein